MAEQEPKPEAPKRRRSNWIGPDNLNSRERLFVGFLAETECDPVKAARMAGYSHPRVQGPRLAKRPRIRAVIASELAAFALSRQETLARLSEIASCDIGEHIEIGPDGALRIAVNPSRSYAVRSITTGKGGTKLELVDKLKALEILFRFHRLADSPSDRDGQAAHDLVLELQAASEACDRDEQQPPRA